MQRAPPQNGQLDCQRHRQTPTIACEVTCNRGFEFIDRPAHKYFCHPTGITFTSPPGKTFDWPDCTRRHDKKGIKNEIWFEYALEDEDANCKDNMQELKKRFRDADAPWLSSSQIPGFSYFTRIRLRCGNRDEVLRLGNDNELEEVLLSTDAASVIQPASSPWARSLHSSKLTTEGFDHIGFSIDRVGNTIDRNLMKHDPSLMQKQLWDKKQLAALKRKSKRVRHQNKKKARHQESHKTRPGRRFRREGNDSSVFFVQLRLIQFPSKIIVTSSDRSDQ